MRKESGLGEFWDQWIEETEELEKQNKAMKDKIVAEAKAKNELIEKHLQIDELFKYAIGVPEMKYFNLDSDDLLDEKIEVLTALKEGKCIEEIPNFYKVLEDLPVGQHWDP